MLTVYHCSMGGNQEKAEVLRPIIEKLGMQLVRMSEWKQHDILWNEKTWIQDLSKADIIICPQTEWKQPCKSNTKVTQAMALGLPVICSPLPAYLECIESGKNGFIASTLEQWEEFLTDLRDPAVRKRIGKAAKESIENYSIKSVGNQWIQVIKDMCLENCGS